jgi:hypothetical protein
MKLFRLSLNINPNNDYVIVLFLVATGRRSKGSAPFTCTECRYIRRKCVPGEHGVSINVRTIASYAIDRCPATAKWQLLRRQGKKAPLITSYPQLKYNSRPSPPSHFFFPHPPGIAGPSHIPHTAARYEADGARNASPKPRIKETFFHARLNQFMQVRYSLPRVCQHYSQVVKTSAPVKCWGSGA